MLVPTGWSRSVLRMKGPLTFNIPRLVIVLGLLDALGPLSIDLYLPGFPELKADLGLSDATVALTLSAMTAGLALGQAVVGAWSDSVGRRRLLLMAAAIYALASVGSAAAPNLAVIVSFRFLQGVSAGGCAVLVLAIVRDLSDGAAFVTLLGRITLLTTSAPLAAPVLGALLLPVVGWRGLFLVLALVAAVLTFAVALVLPETRKQQRAAQGSRLRGVLGDRAFLSGLLLGVGTYAGVYTYVASAPLLLRGVYGLSAPAFAGVFLSTSLGLLLGVQIGSRMAKRFGTTRVLVVCVVVAGCAALALLVIGRTGLVTVVLSLWFFVAACGAVFPCAAAIALAKQGDQAGTATSVYGFTTFTAAALISPIPGLLVVSGTTPVGAILLATSALLICTTAVIAVRNRRLAQSPVRSPRSSRAASSGTPDLNR